MNNQIDTIQIYFNGNLKFTVKGVYDANFSDLIEYLNINLAVSNYEVYVNGQLASCT